MLRLGSKGLLLLALQQFVSAGVQLVTAATATPSFVIAPGTATQESNPALANQAYSKQWTINPDTDGSIAALETLALDLPGQVFVSYALAPSSAPKQLASVKVFGATAAFVDSVAVTSKRAMRGAKLAVSHAGASAAKSSDTNAALLTELVVMRKTALKKVIANGWADVVIGDNVLFSRTKADYSFGSTRALLAQSEPTFTVLDAARAVNRSAALSVVRATWTVISPTASSASQDKITFSVAISGEGFAFVNRVDSDLLPDGSVGTVEVRAGDIDVTAAFDDTASQQATLAIAPKASSSNNANTTVIVNLAPSVEVTKITKTAANGSTSAGSLADLNVTFPIDALTIFLNGSGNVFVLANNSAVYVANADFRVAGSGSLQVEVGELRSVAGVSVAQDFIGATTTSTSTTGVAIQETMMCEWSTNSYSTMYFGSSTQTPKPTKCTLLSVPMKVGGTPAAATTAPMTNTTNTTSSIKSSATKIASTTLLMLQSILLCVFAASLTIQ